MEPLLSPAQAEDSDLERGLLPQDTSGNANEQDVRQYGSHPLNSDTPVPGSATADDRTEAEKSIEDRRRRDRGRGTTYLLLRTLPTLTDLLYRFIGIVACLTAVIDYVIVAVIWSGQEAFSYSYDLWSPIGYSFMLFHFIIGGHYGDKDRALGTMDSTTVLS